MFRHPTNHFLERGIENMAPNDPNDVFSTEVKKRNDQMIELLDSINVDDLESEGLRISLGGKTFTFKDIEVVNDESVEERIRNEFRDKLNTQQQKIRDKINAKINQLLVMHQQKQRELDRKEEKMRKKFSETAKMPDLNETHLAKGLSVVKGSTSNSLIWVYNGFYNPRFIIHYPNSRVSDYNKVRKPIPQRLANKMKQPMLVLVYTKDNKVTRVATKTVDKLQPFPHYHQQTTSDCWGNWRVPSSWNTPDDILQIAKTAESVLETINEGSLAERSPSGLPRIATIIKAIKNVDPVDENIIKKTSGRDLRRRNDDNLDADIWSSL
jgi:hypothetical protein